MRRTKKKQTATATAKQQKEEENRSIECNQIKEEYMLQDKENNNKLKIEPPYQRPTAKLQTVVDCLIEMDGFSKEGIFRLTKNEGRVKYLIAEFDNLQKENLLKEDPYDLASLIKAWARNPKRKPIFMNGDEMISLIKGDAQIIDNFIKVKEVDEIEFINILQRIAIEVDKKSSLNKMSWEGMARVIGPNLYRNRDPKIEMNNIKLTIQATLILLQHGI